MDYFSDDSAYSSFSLNEPADSTPEDKITRKRWARGVLAFYICLFLAGATNDSAPDCDLLKWHRTACLLAD
jgi:hypothetical protein